MTGAACALCFSTSDETERNCSTQQHAVGIDDPARARSARRTTIDTVPRRRCFRYALRASTLAQDCPRRRSASYPLLFSDQRSHRRYQAARSTPSGGCIAGFGGSAAMPPRCSPAPFFAFSCSWPGRCTTMLVTTSIWHQTTPHGRLMLTVLGGLAEFERELIRARTGEGRARAVKNGVKLGRKPKLTPHQIREVLRRRHIHQRQPRDHCALLLPANAPVTSG
jgi:Resolvase, N terminal domain